MPVDKLTKKWIGPSKSDDYLQNRTTVPQVSALMAQGVSGVRRDILAAEVDQGFFRDGAGSSNKENGLTQNSYVTSSVGGKKYAQVISSGGNYGGSTGNTVQQSPEVYSPLWLNSNINLPRDRATINAWCRSFYALNPFVHNAINLHSTYPISKLNIKCPNKDIEKFFNDMIEEIDLMNICVQIAQEYWLLGESFIYAELDQSKGKWSRLVIQNPDYMIAQHTINVSEPSIMLRPDENLKKIIFSNKSSDIEQRKQLNQHIIDSVKRGENIPLNNFNVSHLARRISPYEIRGTGLPVCVFRQLMLFDKLRECYSTDCEVLTDQGFKTIDKLMIKTSNINLNSNYVNGAELDENGQISSILTLKENFKVACINPKTDEIEYHVPTELHMSVYNGKMIHFSGEKIDTLVTPNHKMWANEQIDGKWGEYQKVPAIKMLEKEKCWKFNSKSKYISKDSVEFVNICNKQIPIELCLKVLGHIISDNYIYESFKNEKYDAKIYINKLASNNCYQDIKQFFSFFADKKYNSYIKELKYSSKEKYEFEIYDKNLSQYFKNEIEINKHLPRWSLNLKPELLKIILNSLILDNVSRYSTVSKQLANDIYEIVYKIGHIPNIHINNIKKSNEKIVTEYTVLWSTTNCDNELLVCNSEKSSKNNDCVAVAEEVDYNGVVWCFEVPTGLFITRRNGKITIQGNSKFSQADGMINPLTLVKIGTDDVNGLRPTFADIEAYRDIFEQGQNNKDFKIFTHSGVAVERVGYGQGIYDISGDITQIIKEIYVGLQVPPVLMDGGADTTYANGGVALDVLRQRYMGFRNMMSLWLKRKIFAPISKIQNFYDYSSGEKQLIVPEIDWNHMSLFDAGDYIQTLVSLTQGVDDQKRASLHTLYRSMGLEFEDETRKIRKEAIQNAIAQKEKIALTAMDLNSLRVLNEDDEIPQPDTQAQPGAEAPVPGQSPLSGLPGLDLGGPSMSMSPPPMPPSMPSGNLSPSAPPPTSSPSPAPSK